MHHLKTKPWASAEIFPGGKRRHFAYPFLFSGGAMETDVNKTLYLFYSTKEMPHVTTTVKKRASFAA